MYDYSDIERIKSKPISGRTFEENLLLKWYSFSGYPKLRSPIYIFKDDKYFYELLKQHKPIFVAFTTKRHFYCAYLKRKLREIAPHFKDDAIFLEVDCSFTPEFCEKYAYAGVPSIDVYHLKVGNEVPNTYRYHYHWSNYGVLKFLEDYQLGGRRNVWNGIYDVTMSSLSSIDNEITPIESSEDI